MNEDTYICKAFRYHEVNDTGYCDYPCFRKALTPFSSGVGEDELRAIFERYARNGLLDYREFVSGVRRSPDGADLDDDQYETVDETISRIKNFLYSSGPYAVVGLAMAFRNADPQNKRTMPYEAFHHTLVSFFTDTDCPITEEQTSE